MNKSLRWVLTLIVALAVVTIVVTQYNKKHEQYYNKVNYTQKVFIVNKTPMQYADTVIAIGMKMLELQPRLIVLRPFREPANKDDVEDLQAYVYGIDNQYVIWTKEFNRRKVLKVLSHEMIHIEQMERGLLQVTDSTVTYKGVVYNNNTMPDYIDRPWEQDAEEDGYTLTVELTEILVNK